MDLVNILWRILKAATSPFGELCCDILFERSLLDPLPEAKTTLEAVLRKATPADVDEICRLYSGDPWLYLGDAGLPAGADDRARERYLDRLERGELCFIASVAATTAHVNWVCLSWGDALPGHPIHLAPTEVFTTDGLTVDAFRSRGLHAYVLRAMLVHARSLGRTHAYTLGRIDRKGSYKGLFQLGWRECGRVVYLLPRRRSRAWFLIRRGKLEPLFRAL